MDVAAANQLQSSCSWESCEWQLSNFYGSWKAGPPSGCEIVNFWTKSLTFLKIYDIIYLEN
jgi:hypothetical protein